MLHIICGGCGSSNISVMHVIGGGGSHGSSTVHACLIGLLCQIVYYMCYLW